MIGLSQLAAQCAEGHMTSLESTLLSFVIGLATAVVALGAYIAKRERDHRKDMMLKGEAWSQVLRAKEDSFVSSLANKDLEIKKLGEARVREQREMLEKHIEALAAQADMLRDVREVLEQARPFGRDGRAE